MRGGEPERGRKTISVEEGPLTFWSMLAPFFDFSRPGMECLLTFSLKSIKNVVYGMAKNHSVFNTFASIMMKTIVCINILKINFLDGEKP